MTASRRLTAVLVFVATLFLQVAWIFAVPPYRGMDEFDHVYRAEAVAEGHWLPEHQSAGYQGRGDLVRARAGTVRAAYPICHAYSYIPETDCLPRRTFSDGTVLIASGAARYNPLYYWVVGTPARWFDAIPSLYAMRMLNAVLCSLLVALAAWATTLWSRSRWPLLGVLTVCTPAALYSGTTPAPNGPEIFAGVALWTILLGLGRFDPGDRRVTALLTAIVPAALVLTGVRTLGPFWLALVLLSVAPIIGLRHTWMVARAHVRLVLGISILVGMTTVAALWWTRFAGANSLTHEVDKHRPDALASSLRMIPLWIFQSIGAFPDKFDSAPNLVYGSAVLIMAGFLVWALKRADLRLGLALVVVGGVGLAVPFAITWRTYSQLGPVWQGRYAWPYASGTLMVAALILDRTRARLPRPALTTLVMVGFVLVQLPGPLGVLFDEAESSPLAGTSSWLLPLPGLVAASAVAGLSAWLFALLGVGPRPAAFDIPPSDRAKDHNCAPIQIDGTATTDPVRLDSLDPAHDKRRETPV